MEIRRVTTKAELQRFIKLPLDLPDQRPNAVPPMMADERELHDPAKNEALAHCTVACWLAWRDGTAVGRIMGIIHHGWNEATGERTARFFQLDAICDQYVVGALLATVEEWARSQGMDRVIGPFGFSDKDPQGLQVEGFEHLPVLATPTNPEWIPLMLDTKGYAAYEEMVSYRMELVPDMFKRFGPIAERCMRSLGLRRVPLPNKRALRPWVVPVLRTVNDTYGGLLGFVPMSEKEMHALATKYMFILDPELVEIIVDPQDVPMAFVIASPDMSEGQRKANGSLFPFGWFHILRAMRRSRQLDLLLGAVRPHLQGRGLTAVLALNLLSTAHRRGFTHLDSHLVMTRNTRMCAQMERLGGKVWKRYRVYSKALL